MQIELWNFSKRFNSTKVPSGSGTTTQAVLKQMNNDTRGMAGITDTALSAPHFMLEWSGYFTANYCRAFGLYYFIQDVYYGINNAVELSCVVDVLASFKSEILGTTAKVLYSSSLYDLNTDDTRNQLTELMRSATNYSADQFFPSPSSPYIITTLSTSDISDSGFAVSYATNRAGLDTLITKLTNGDFLEDLTNFLMTPIDCVVGFMVTDFPMAGQGTPTTIKLGSINTGVAGEAIGMTSFGSYETTINIPHIYGDYRDGSRCSKYLLTVPYCGTLDISSDLLYGYETLRLRAYIDLNTCDMTVQVAVCNNYGQATMVERPIDVINGNCGRQIPIGQIIGPNNAQAVGIGGALGSAATAAAFGTGKVGTAMSAAGSIATTGAEALAASTAVALGVSGIALGAGYIAGKKIQASGTQFKGSYNSIIGKHNTMSTKRAELTQYAQVTCDVPLAIKDTLGLPLNRTVLLSTLSGYCQCDGASVNISSVNELRTMVNTFVNGGFYIE